MKTVASLALLALTANGAVVKRQADLLKGLQIPGLEGFKLPAGFDLSSIAKSLPKGGLTGLLNPEVKTALKVEKIPTLRNVPGAERVRITYGPYKIKASGAKESPGNTYSMDPAGTGYSNLVGPDFPKDITIIDSDTRLVNETFQKAMVEDGLYNHHITYMDMNKKVEPWLSCAGKPVQEMPVSFFMGAGSEDIDSKYTPALTSTVKAGYYIGKDDLITVGMDIVNYHDKQREVYIITEMEYLKGLPAGYKHAQSRIVYMGACDGANAMMSAGNIHPPKDKKKFVLTGKNDIEIMDDGYLVGTFGHLHDGGLKMVIKVNGKEACTSSITYGGEGHEQVQANGEVWKTIGRTIGCLEPIAVKKGDKLNMEAFFDFEEHPPRMSAHGEEAEGMALVATTFVKAS